MAALAPLDPPLPLIMLMISGSDSLSKRTLRKEERKAPPTSSAAMFTRSRKYERRHFQLIDAITAALV
ncbi:uncharacterized protein DS421_12g382120 [Arachis hypogaea]|nr:uncharacterized protein DS421_12g382120 [Arachis hypogaea]